VSNPPPVVGQAVKYTAAKRNVVAEGEETCGDVDVEPRESFDRPAQRVFVRHRTGDCLFAVIGRDQPVVGGGSQHVKGPGDLREVVLHPCRCVIARFVEVVNGCTDAFTAGGWRVRGEDLLNRCTYACVPIRRATDEKDHDREGRPQARARHAITVGQGPDHDWLSRASRRV
jgi:hypothetical protein